MRTARPGPTVVDVLALCAGCVALAATIAAQGGALSLKLDLLTALAPLWLGIAAATTAFGALAARGRMRLALLSLGAAALVGAAGLIAPEAARPVAAQARLSDGPRLKLIQFNVWDRNADVAGTADWILGEQPDLVLMEEADPRISAALLARGYRLSQGIGHVAIFSRRVPERNTVGITIPQWHALPPFARAEFDRGGARFAVLAVHLAHETHPGAAEAQEALAALVNRYDRRRLIVAGDFNLTPWSFGLRRWERGVRLTRRDPILPSWPAKLASGAAVGPAIPFLPIDHIYAGADWKTLSVTTGPALGSDHLPLVVTLALARA